MKRTSTSKLNLANGQKVDPAQLYDDEERMQEPQSFREFLAMHPRYRLRWWRAVWSEAIRRGRWPRLIYLAIGISFLLVWIGVT